MPPLIEAGFADKDGKGDPRSLAVYGPSVQVEVGTMLPEPDGSEIDSPRETVHALIDTGASESCIDEDLAQTLQLPVVDKIKISGVGGAEDHNVYLARVDIIHLGTYQYGRFAGVKLAEGGQLHQVLLGRTLLQDCIMIYDGLRGFCTIASTQY